MQKIEYRSSPTAVCIFYGDMLKGINFFTQPHLREIAGPGLNNSLDTFRFSAENVKGAIYM